MKTLINRLIFSVLALAVVAFGIFNQRLGRPATLIVVELLTLLALRELIKLMKISDLSMPYVPVFGLGILLPVVFYAEEGAQLDVGVTLLVFGCGPLLVLFAMAGGVAKLMERIAVSAFAFLYIILPLSLAIYLRESESPATLLFLVVLATVSTDTGAFVFGKSLGRHKLAPKWSPNKTWEGAVGGVVSALAMVLVVGAAMAALGVAKQGLEGTSFFLIRGWGMGKVMAATLLFSVFGQMGDLAESMFKREAGVKDSGNGLMGHGGVLDRIDSHLFNLPLAAALKLIF